MPSSRYLKLAQTFMFATLAIMCGFEQLYAKAAIQHSETDPSSGLNRTVVYSAPISFEPNQGQASSAFHYVAHEPGLGMGLAADGIHFAMSKDRQPVSVQFIGSDKDVALSAEDPQPGKVNYLRGADPNKWQTNIPTFARVRYHELYPGIDLVFYGNGRRVEHDFVLSPGSNPREVQFKIIGARKIHVDRSGDLVLESHQATLRFNRPIAYQNKGSRKTAVTANYRVRGTRVSFQIGDYDRSLPLVVDPVLTYATYLGGSTSESNSFIAIDALGSAYVSGMTWSADFPTTGAAAYRNCNCSANYPSDLFVTKFSADGSALVYSTYLGGSDYDQTFGIAVDSAGRAIVVGRTSSQDFPLIPSGQTFPEGGGGNRTHGFIATLNATGTALAYSHLFGGSYDDLATAVAVDSHNNVYVGGLTDSTDFSVTPGTMSSGASGYPISNIAVRKYDTTGAVSLSVIVPANGLSSDPWANHFTVNGIAGDTNGNIYLAGSATNGFPTTASSFQPTLAATPNSQNTNAYVAKMANDGARFTYATYIGGRGPDTVAGLAVDANGNAYAAGFATSSNFPTTPGSFQPTMPGSGTPCCMPFVTKLNAAGSQLLYSTFLSSSSPSFLGYTNIAGIGIDSSGDAYVAGDTNSGGWPLVNPIQSVPATGGSTNPTPRTAFVSELDPNGATLLFSTYLSGSNGDNASGIVVDGSGTPYITGTTFDQDFPVTAQAYQKTVVPPPANTQPGHIFVAKLNLSTPAGAVCFSSAPLYFGNVALGSSANSAETITNCGNGPLNIASITVTGNGNSDFSQTNTCSATLQPTSTCKVTVTFSPTATIVYGSSISESATLTVTSNASIGTSKLPVSGTAAEPLVQVMQTPIYPQLIGTTAPTSAVVGIENSGSAELKVSSATLSQTSTDFKIVSNYCTTLPLGVVYPGQNCGIQISFTPTQAGTRTATLTVTDNAPDSPQVISLSGEGLASYPVPTINFITPQGVAAGSADTPLAIAGSNFFPNSVIRINGVDHTTSYFSNGMLNTTIAASEIGKMSENAVTVFTPSSAAGTDGGTSNSVPLIAYLSVPISAADLVFDPYTRLLWASIPSEGRSNQNMIVSIDPTTGAVGTPSPIGNEPWAEALSDDGQFLYVGLRGDYAIQRVKLSSVNKDIKIPLPIWQFLSAPEYPFDIKVVPGSPHSVAVSMFVQASPPYGGVAVFDDSTMRGSIINENPDIFEVSNIAFLRDPSKLYGVNNGGLSSGFYVIDLGANGISKNSLVTVSAQFYTPFVSDGNFFYTGSSTVLDATGGAIANYNNPLYPSAVVPDSPLGRTYFLNSNSTVAAYSQTSQQEVGTLNFGDSFNASGLTRWGSDGFAMRIFNNNSSISQIDQILLFRSSLAHPSPGPNPVPAVTSVSPASSPVGASNFVATVTGSGFVAGAVVLWNGAERSTTFVSATQLKAYIPMSDVAVATTANVSVANPPSGGGQSNTVSFAVVGNGPLLQLSSTSVSFAPQVNGTASAVQVVTVTNTGTANLQISVITNTGDFSNSSNCSAPIAPSSSCTISITFTPTAAGVRNGSVVITSNANGSPQSISVTGTGTDLQISGSGSGPISATVTSGETATYNLSLISASGFAGAVTFSCAGAPQYSTCIVNPSSVNLAANGTTAVTVTVNTSQTVTALVTTRSPVFFAGIGLVGLFSLLPIARKRKQLRKQLLQPMFVFLAALGLAIGGMVACGGGGGNTPPPSTTTVNKVAPGTYVLTLSATSGSTVRTVKLNLTVQ